jgi:uncharacterized protein involved in exopolysaccharide biosynthesis
VTELKEKLKQSEDKLTKFLVQNTLYQQSPVLLQEYIRLSRAIELQQKVSLELDAQLLAARMELSSQTPSVRVLSQPTMPLHSSFPERLKLAILAMFAMLALNSVGILAVNAVDQAKTTSSSA